MPAPNAPATRAVANKFLPVARRVAKAATVVRRGQKLGTFTDDSLLAVQVDADTRLVQGPRELPAALRTKSFGQRMFPALQKNLALDAGLGGGTADDDEDLGLGDDPEALPGSVEAPRRRPYEEMKGVLHTELLPVAKRGGQETKLKAAELAAQLFLAPAEAADATPYHHKDCTREQAERLLETAAAGHGDHADGLFLVRPAKTAGAIALSVFANGQVLHYQFKQQNGTWTHLGTAFEGCATVAELVARLREPDAAEALCHPLRDHVNTLGNLVCAEAESML